MSHSLYFSTAMFFQKSYLTLVFLVLSLKRKVSLSANIVGHGTKRMVQTIVQLFDYLASSSLSHKFYHFGVQITMLQSYIFI